MGSNSSHINVAILVPQRQRNHPSTLATPTGRFHGSRLLFFNTLITSGDETATCVDVSPGKWNIFSLLTLTQSISLTLLTISLKNFHHLEPTFAGWLSLNILNFPPTFPINPQKPKQRLACVSRSFNSSVEMLYFIWSITSSCPQFTTGNDPIIRSLAMKKHNELTTWSLPLK